jgi:hypothetical protein
MSAGDCTCAEWIAPGAEHLVGCPVQIAAKIEADCRAALARMLDRPLPVVGDKIDGPWEDGVVTAFDGLRMTIACRIPVPPEDICLTIETGAAE